MSRRAPCSIIISVSGACDVLMAGSDTRDFSSGLSRSFQLAIVGILSVR